MYLFCHGCTFAYKKADLDNLYRDFACLRLVTKKDLTKDNDGNIIKIQYHAFGKFFTINLEDETFSLNLSVSKIVCFFSQNI